MAPKVHRPKGTSSNQAEPKPDARFAAIGTDPRYRLPSAKHSRVNVDSRFSRMFKDDDFSKKAEVDRYGRKVKSDSGKRDLEKFYRIEEGEDKPSAKGKGKVLDKKKAKGKVVEVVGSSDEEESEDDEEIDEPDEGDDDDDEIQAELDRVERKGGKSARDYAREGGFSDSSSDEDSDEEEDSDEDEEEVVTFPDEEEAPSVPTGEVTNRLAVVNLDWDNIRATDLMAVAQSFAPGGKGVQNVVVYPSEYGRERLQREELEGPPRDIFASSSKQAEGIDSEEDSEDEDERIKKQLLTEDTGEEFDSAKLRQYQLDRLKYYYAVITCDNTFTAKTLYDDMDGREYLTTANFFDLRFIPDEVSFDTDTPRDECRKMPSGYKPNEFVTDALTHSKVRLTWDADDTTRKEVQKRAFSRAEIDENDLQAYIGSDSDSDDEEQAATNDTDGPKLSKAEQQRAKMRAALGLAVSAPAKSTTGKKAAKAPAAPVGDMQITFTSGLTGPAGEKANVFENTPEEANETTRERYIRKEKERKQRRKEKAKAVRAGMDPEEAAAEDAREEAEEAAAAKQEQDADLGFEDPFFTNAGAAQKLEKEARKAEKAKKRREREEADQATAAQRAELELLMVDDKADNAMRHFDMNEIAKAEKVAKKKGKKGKKSKEVEEKLVDGADFKIETEDPRFGSLFDSHEFAIDPTNPRFTATQGMKALLEEGRKKRKGRDDGEGEERREKKSKKVRQDDDGADGEAQGEDLQKLLARVKAKTGKKNK